LPGSTAGALFGASDGTIWMAAFSETQGWGEGAIAINGSAWRIYNPGNANLYGNAIGGFAQDREGDIWATVDIDFYGTSSGHELGEFVCDSLATELEAALPGDAVLRLYPNPATDRLRLGLPEAENGSVRVTVRDMYGTVVLSRQGNEVIGVSGLASGLYFVEAITPFQIYRGRFLKQ
jgi:hypothetical protein